MNFCHFVWSIYKYECSVRVFVNSIFCSAAVEAEWGLFLSLPLSLYPSLFLSLARAHFHSDDVSGVKS